MSPRVYGMLIIELYTDKPRDTYHNNINRNNNVCLEQVGTQTQ